MKKPTKRQIKVRVKSLMGMDFHDDTRLTLEQATELATNRFIRLSPTHTIEIHNDTWTCD